MNLKIQKINYYLKIQFKKNFSILVFEIFKNHCFLKLITNYEISKKIPIAKRDI